MNRPLRRAPFLFCLALHALALPVTAHGTPWYGGVGAGVSRLSPDTDGSPWALEEEASAAVGVVLGRALGERHALELAVTRLGEAGLERRAGQGVGGEEAVSYTSLAAGALAYLAGDPRRMRRGERWAGFVRLGLGAIEHDSDVDLEEKDGAALWAGLGVDVPFARSWALRAELASFDGDAQAATLALLWRPGTRARPIDAAEAPAVAVADEPSAEVTRTPPPAEVADTPPVELPEEPSDEASAESSASLTPPEPMRESPPAGVSAADCPAPTLPGEPLDARGCALFGGVLEGVGFVADGDLPTVEAGRALGRLAAALAEHPDVVVELRVHAATAALARARAVATARALVGRGVPVERLRARAFADGADASSERIEIGVVALR